MEPRQHTVRGWACTILSLAFTAVGVAIQIAQHGRSAFLPVLCAVSAPLLLMLEHFFYVQDEQVFLESLADELDETITTLRSGMQDDEETEEN